MNTLYSSKIPGVPDSFFGDLVTLDALQQHWLETSARLQRNWFQSVLGLFDYYRTAAQDAQEIQGALFNQYLKLVERWSAAPAAGTEVAPEPRTEDASAAAVAAQEQAAETPRLLGWVVDDLTRIQGIGKVLQQRLYEEAVISYLQIASWDEQEIARIENEVLGSRFAGRVQRDQWQAQARALMEKQS